MRECCQGLELVFSFIKAYMLHSFHGYFRSMDRILRPWMEYLYGNRYLFMVVFHSSHGQKSTNGMYHFHGCVENPWIC